MASIGFDLQTHIDRGLLVCHAVRPTLHGLENHLVSLHRLVESIRPVAVILDPITNFAAVGDTAEVKMMLTRIIDFLKGAGITALFTSLTQGFEPAQLERTDEGVSSLIDTWLMLQMVQSFGERNRLLYVLKSRGMAHSNQVQELVLDNEGLHLSDVYTGAGEVRTGAARIAQETRDQAANLADRKAHEREQRALDLKRRDLMARIQSLEAQLAGVEEDAAIAKAEEAQRVAVAAHDPASTFSTRSVG
jgi:circadian clock protein KaiC